MDIHLLLLVYTTQLFYEDHPAQSEAENIPTMSILARFSDKALFPSFDDLPTALTTDPQPAEEKEAAAREGRPERWFLLGQISENMTITKPTLILRDRNSAAFALTFEEGGVDLKGWKKGYTLVAENARRTESKEEGKRGFVRVEKGEEGGVRCIPGPMDKVIVLGTGMRDGAGECRGCGGEGERKCLGCGWVRYCGKVSCVSTSDDIGARDADGSRTVRSRSGKGGIRRSARFTRRYGRWTRHIGRASRSEDTEYRLTILNIAFIYQSRTLSPCSTGSPTYTKHISSNTQSSTLSLGSPRSPTYTEHTLSDI